MIVAVGPNPRLRSSKCYRRVATTQHTRREFDTVCHTHFDGRSIVATRRDEFGHLSVGYHPRLHSFTAMRCQRSKPRLRCQIVRQLVECYSERRQFFLVEPRSGTVDNAFAVVVGQQRVDIFERPRIKHVSANIRPIFQYPVIKQKYSLAIVRADERGLAFCSFLMRKHARSKCILFFGGVYALTSCGLLHSTSTLHKPDKFRQLAKCYGFADRAVG